MVGTSLIFSRTNHGDEKKVKSNYNKSNPLFRSVTFSCVLICGAKKLRSFHFHRALSDIPPSRK